MRIALLGAVALLGGGAAGAEPPATQPAPAAEESTHVTFRGNVDWITAAQGSLLADSDANPQNRFFATPALQLSSELRPNLRVEYGTLSLILRPRFAAELSAASVGDEWQPVVLRYTGEWIELYGAWTVNDSLSLAYGLQNFQWGPAESLSPSNRLSHQTNFASTLLTVWRGKELLRANLSIGKSFSAVALIETAASADPELASNDPFERKGQLKLEYTTPDGAGYVGVVAGKGETWRPWFGEYASYSVTDGLSVYADASHGLGTRAWYPSFDSTSFARSHLQDDALFTLVVAGARYTFAGGTDVRLEYIHDDAGWTRDEVTRAVEIVAQLAAVDPQVLGPYAAPGLELPGQDYLYLSARFPDLGKKKAFAVHVRGLYAITDGSLAVLTTAEWAATDSLLLYLAGAAVAGDRDRELTRLVRGNLLVAGKLSF